MTADFVRSHMAGGIPVAEVAKHAEPDNCWIVVNNKVYDLTKFAPDHPGGADSAFVFDMYSLLNQILTYRSGLQVGRQGWLENIQHVSFRGAD